MLRPYVIWNAVPYGWRGKSQPPYEMNTNMTWLDNNDKTVKVPTKKVDGSICFGHFTLTVYYSIITFTKQHKYYHIEAKTYKGPHLQIIDDDSALVHKMAWHQNKRNAIIWNNAYPNHVMHSNCIKLRNFIGRSSIRISTSMLTLSSDECVK